MIPSVVTKEESALDQHESKDLMKLSDHGGSGGGLTVREKKKRGQGRQLPSMQANYVFPKKDLLHIYTLS